VLTRTESRRWFHPYSQPGSNHPRHNCYLLTTAITTAAAPAAWNPAAPAAPARLRAATPATLLRATTPVLLLVAAAPAAVTPATTPTVTSATPHVNILARPENIRDLHAPPFDHSFGELLLHEDGSRGLANDLAHCRRPTITTRGLTEGTQTFATLRQPKLTFRYRAGYVSDRTL